jgi:hypothetical protein
MSTQKSITIHNRSNIVVHYQWKKYATLAEERNTKDMLVKILQFTEQYVPFPRANFFAKLLNITVSFSESIWGYQ